MTDKQVIEWHKAGVSEATGRLIPLEMHSLEQVDSIMKHLDTRLYHHSPDLDRLQRLAYNAYVQLSNIFSGSFKPYIACKLIALEDTEV